MTESIAGGGGGGGGMFGNVVDFFLTAWHADATTTKTNTKKSSSSSSRRREDTSSSSRRGRSSGRHSSRSHSSRRSRFRASSYDDDDDDDDDDDSDIYSDDDWTSAASKSTATKKSMQQHHYHVEFIPYSSLQKDGDDNQDDDDDDDDNNDDKDEHEGEEVEELSLTSTKSSSYYREFIPFPSAKQNEKDDETRNDIEEEEEEDEDDWCPSEDVRDITEQPEAAAAAAAATAAVAAAAAVVFAPSHDELQQSLEQRRQRLVAYRESTANRGSANKDSSTRRPSSLTKAASPFLAELKMRLKTVTERQQAGIPWTPQHDLHKKSKQTESTNGASEGTPHSDRTPPIHYTLSHVQRATRKCPKQEDFVAEVQQWQQKHKLRQVNVKRTDTMTKKESVKDLNLANVANSKHDAKKAKNVRVSTTKKEVEKKKTQQSWKRFSLSCLFKKKTKSVVAKPVVPKKHSTKAIDKMADLKSSTLSSPVTTTTAGSQLARFFQASGSPSGVRDPEHCEGKTVGPKSSTTSPVTPATGFQLPGSFHAVGSTAGVHDPAHCKYKATEETNVPPASSKEKPSIVKTECQAPANEPEWKHQAILESAPSGKLRKTGTETTMKKVTDASLAMRSGERSIDENKSRLSKHRDTELSIKKSVAPTVTKLSKKKHEKDSSQKRTAKQRKVLASSESATNASPVDVVIVLQQQPVMIASKASSKKSNTVASSTSSSIPSTPSFAISARNHGVDCASVQTKRQQQQQQQQQLQQQSQHQQKKKRHQPPKEGQGQRRLQSRAAPPPPTTLLADGESVAPTASRARKRRDARKAKYSTSLF